MITNKRQSRAAEAQARRLEQALRKRKGYTDRLDPRLGRALNEGVQAQIDELRDEVAEYARLKASSVEDLELGSLHELPLLLVRARIARGLTQKDFARRLGLKEEQVQCYESTNYRLVNLERVLEIAKMLGVDLRGPAKLRQTEVP